MLLNTDVVSSGVKMSRCLLSSQKSELVNNHELFQNTNSSKTSSDRTALY